MRGKREKRRINNSFFSPLTSQLSPLTSSLLTCHLSPLTLFFPSLLRVPGRQRHPAGSLTVEADLEGILTGPWQGDVEYQHGSGFDVHDTCGRFAELHGTLTSQ